MSVTALALHSPRAISDVLRRHGWEESSAAVASGGIDPIAFHASSIGPAALEALVLCAGRLGLEVLTGESWAILAGSRARVSAFARPWLVPDELRDLAMQVGLALPGEPPCVWQTARGPIALDHPVILGILNATPDSFSDGGRLATIDAARTHAEQLVAAGAAILDVGGESTRPGRTESVPLDEELRRVMPVVAALARALPDVPISVDTVKAAVAAAALDAGAAIVNDVSALRLDSEMSAVVAERRAGVVLMHSRGSITELSSYTHADYGNDLVGAVVGELRCAVTAAVAAGVAPDAIVVDPGFGFSKTTEQSIVLLDQLAALRSLGRPVLVGPSRKRFLGNVTGQSVEERDGATAVAGALAYERGARLFRVHSVPPVRDALALAVALGGP